MKKFKEKKELINFLYNSDIDPDIDNWGEKVPYFPSARKYPIVKYCKEWNSFFGEKARILHIVRNPYDVALSNVKKFKTINTIEKPLNIYKKIVPTAIEEISKMKNSEMDYVTWRW